jgi:hypothetical protein
MKRFVLLGSLVLVLVGCGGLPFTQADDENKFRVPLVCLPEHKQLPCTAVVKEGVAYRFNLLTHCGVKWAYFAGRFWVPSPKLKPPSDWANIESGVMVLVDPQQAVFEADKGGSVHFAPAPNSYRPPTCA